MDVSGEQHEEIEHTLTKQRLDKSGKKLGDPFTHHLGHKETVTNYSPPNGCGSCYGAESPKYRCCNSCDDLKEAYKLKGWSVANLENTADQCKAEHASAAAQAQQGEGCRVAGTLSLNKVGNVLCRCSCSSSYSPLLLGWTRPSSAYHLFCYFLLFSCRWRGTYMWR